MIYKVSILIPVYNRLEITKIGLESIYSALNEYNKTGRGSVNFEIVVIDDGSTDGTSDWIAQNYPNIHIKEGDGNLWWSGSINKGAKFSIDVLKSDYLLLWNDDTICDINYFIVLNKILQNDKLNNSIIVSKVLWQHNPSVLFNFGCMYNQASGKIIVNGFNKKDDENYNQINKIDCSGGMGTLIPKEIIQKVNYFDSENFPQYFGDIDFFLRAKNNGFSTFAIPDLIIYNDIDTTGKKKIRKFKDIKDVLFSNQSNLNLRQNFIFNKTHSNTFLSWIRLVLKTIRNLIMTLI
jgi:GT2 family glycosyltransferase